MSPWADNKVHGANMGPTWVLSAPDGPHVGPINLAIKYTTTNSGAAITVVGTDPGFISKHHIRPVLMDQCWCLCDKMRQWWSAISLGHLILQWKHFNRVWLNKTQLCKNMLFSCFIKCSNGKYIPKICSERCHKALSDISWETFQTQTQTQTQKVFITENTKVNQYIMRLKPIRVYLPHDKYVGTQ